MLSVETIAVPMLDGFVDAECSFYMDSRLESLAKGTANKSDKLVDILRVFYEITSSQCAQVGLLDFLPRFQADSLSLTPLGECLTSVVRRALHWFADEQKRCQQNDKYVCQCLKLCNLQICRKQVKNSNVLSLNTRQTLSESNVWPNNCNELLVTISFVRLAFIAKNNSNSKDESSNLIDRVFERHAQDEFVYHLPQSAQDTAFNNSFSCFDDKQDPFVCLTYRLFAPSQRVVGKKSKNVAQPFKFLSSSSSSHQTLSIPSKLSKASIDSSAFQAANKKALDEFESVASMRKRIQVYVTTNCK